jgi:hypothetical protein
MKNKIFYGGTWAGSTWRDELIPLVQVDYFDPIVKDWTLECQAEEKNQKEHLCNVHFYLISKEMQGVFSIAEVIDSAHTKGKVTILHVVPDGFENNQLKSLRAVVDMVMSLGGIAYFDNDIRRSARVLNNCFQ